MTASRDIDRMIHDYLEDGPTQLADRSLDAVRSEIDGTRQRAVIGPWRWSDIFAVGRFAIAGVVVLAVALVGIGLLGNSGGIGGPGVTPSPTPSSTPITSPPTIAPIPMGAKMDPGTYAGLGLTPAGAPPLSYTLTVPDGWFSFSGQFINTGTADPPTGASFSIWDLTDVGVYRDPCPAPSVGFSVDHPADPTAADLASLLARLASDRLVMPPTNVEMAGYAGTLMEIKVPDDANSTGSSVFPDCASKQYRIWVMGGADDRYGQGPGQHDRLWILDVSGRRIVIDATFYSATPAATMAELDDIVNSVRIEP